MHASLRAHDADLSERERKLKEECAHKISAQEKQIELISASLIKLDRSRHRVVTQRNGTQVRIHPSQITSKVQVA